MKKIYYNTTQSSKCFGIIMEDAEIVLAGTPIYSMPIELKNEEYEEFAKEYDIHFIFEDNLPNIDFYTVPMVEVFANDSLGGYIGSLGKPTNLQDDIPVCYIDINKNCYIISNNGEDFINNAPHWKEKLIPYTDIEFFNSFEDASKKYEFLDTTQLEEDIKEIEKNLSKNKKTTL